MATQLVEGQAEGRAVDRVQREARRPPARPARDPLAKHGDVRVVAAEQALVERLGEAPDGRGDGSGRCSADAGAAFIRDLFPRQPPSIVQPAEDGAAADDPRSALSGRLAQRAVGGHEPRARVGRRLPDQPVVGALARRCRATTVVRSSSRSDRRRHRRAPCRRRRAQELGAVDGARPHALAAARPARRPGRSATATAGRCARPRAPSSCVDGGSQRGDVVAQSAPGLPRRPRPRASRRRCRRPARPRRARARASRSRSRRRAARRCAARARSTRPASAGESSLARAGRPGQRDEVEPAVGLLGGERQSARRSRSARRAGCAAARAGRPRGGRRRSGSSRRPRARRSAKRSQP